MPFEIHEMKARLDGFELTFTQPVDRDSASNTESYKLETYAYIYQGAYGSPEVDHTTPTIDRIVVSEDGQAARLYVTVCNRATFTSCTATALSQKPACRCSTQKRTTR